MEQQPEIQLDSTREVGAADPIALNTLFLTDRFLPHAGGARVYYYNLYKNLVQHFTDRITVVTKEVPGWRKFDALESTERLRIIRRFKPLDTWKYYQLPQVILPLIQAIKILATEKIDLIHFGDLFPQGLVSLWLKNFTGIPYLAYCHGDEMAQIENRRYQPLVFHPIYRRADAVIAANGFARQKLLDIGIPEDRIHKITPGVDCERFRPQPLNRDWARRWGLEDRTVLLTAARLVPKKGHKAVIRAVAKILPEIPNLRYLIVGDGSQRESLQALVRELGMADVITFVGDVANECLPEFYNLCDVFVMANRQGASGDIETFGMVFVEANATGKPVVGGRSGGTYDAIVHGVTGFLVNPDDVDELAATLKLLLTNRTLRQTLGNAGLHRARTDFDWRSRAEYLHQISVDIRQRRRGGTCQPLLTEP